jgi:hypothetical protein
MKPVSIRWRQYTPPEAKRQCAEWLRGRGYMPLPVTGDIWIVRKAFA